MLQESEPIENGLILVIMKETIIERALKVAGIATIIAAGILSTYAIRIILWACYALGYVM